VQALLSSEDSTTGQSYVRASVGEVEAAVNGASVTLTDSKLEQVAGNYSLTAQTGSLQESVTGGSGTWGSSRVVNTNYAFQNFVDSANNRSTSLRLAPQNAALQATSSLTPYAYVSVIYDSTEGGRVQVDALDAAGAAWATTQFKPDGIHGSLLGGRQVLDGFTIDGGTF